MHAPTGNEKVQQDQRIEERLSKIRHVVAVLSGKGGVGKSTVAANLAFALALQDYRVGILDIDVHGPNVPKMLGIEDRRFSGDETHIEPVEVLPNLLATSIALAGYDPDSALIWRGPIKIGLIRQFIADVEWGELDYLIVDTPPGTGDEQLTLAQIVPQMTGAVLVTTPQDVAILDSRKSFNFAGKLNVPVIGVVENMSGFVCPDCGSTHQIFKTGGGKRAAESLGTAFLGAVPIEPGVVEAGDSGRPIVAAAPESASARAFTAIAGEVVRRAEELSAAGRAPSPQPHLKEPSPQRNPEDVPEAIRQRDGG